MFQCVTSLTDKRAEGRKWVEEEEEEQEGPQKKHEKKNQIYPSSCKKLASSESNYVFFRTLLVRKIIRLKRYEMWNKLFFGASKINSN